MKHGFLLLCTLCFHTLLWAQDSTLPSNPQPAHQATGVTAGTPLSWTPPTTFVPDRYTILVSETLDFMDAQIFVVTDGNSCSPVLESDKSYNWMVAAYDGGNAYASPIWTFSTTQSYVPVGPAGDLNGDFTVDESDLALFASQWLTDAECVGDDCADFDGQGGVNAVDFAVMASQWHQSFASVMINEIHYHPDNNTEPVEFVELYNASTQDVNVSGWTLEGVTYEFPAGTVIQGQGYLVVTQNPLACAFKFGVYGLGPFEGKLRNEGEHLELRDAQGDLVDEVTYGSDSPWPIAANGEGASMELLHPGLDNDLAGSWRSSGYHQDRPEYAYGLPTPSAKNSVHTTHVPPQVRQIKHVPDNPMSNVPVKITAKATDLDGVHSVILKYQIVLPGEYIPAYLPIDISALIADPYQDQPLNPAFEAAANWTEVVMKDDGLGLDDVAGDDVYTAEIPGQDNRTLVRYRIVAEDEAGFTAQLPYADDASLNFAYYVYNGVPDYVATEDSVSPDGPGQVYSSEILTSLPVYTLITREEDLYQCNGYNGRDRIDQSSSAVRTQDAGRAYNWEGTFVYDGNVYDHIGYRLRGGNGRYNYSSIAGKRSMKFRFNRGHYFQARDIYGDKFPSKWQHLNTGKMFGNRIMSGYNRYPYGLNEIMDMRLFDIANVPAPHTWWMHFRVVDGPEEAPTGQDGQYLGDFWGLYIAFENYDGAFLDRLGLPKGNLYKLSDKVYEGERQLRYQGPDAVEDASDYENIRWNLTHQASADFIQKYLDCDEWYRYHTITEAIRHYDIFSGDSCMHCLKNSAWFFYPDYSTNPYGRLQFLPFDVDDTWGPYFNNGVDHAKAAIYDQRFTGGLEQFAVDPEKSPLKQAYRNYIREFSDLHWQPEVINGMIDELAAVIEDFVPADRDRWRLDQTVPGNPMDNGTLEECVALMKQFAWTPGSFQGGFYWQGTVNNLEDLAGDEGDSFMIPNTPSIAYTGEPNYPVNDLTFVTSSFSDPQGNHTFEAMKWRIAEYDLNYASVQVEDTELLGREQVWQYFKGTQQPPSNWTQSGFDDSGWQTGQTPIGYSDRDDNTDLSDQTPPMRNNYSTVYLRHTFDVLDKNEVQTLTLHVYVDDGCIVYLNGTEVLRKYCSDGLKFYNSTTNASDHEASGYEQIVLTGPYDYLVNGENVIAVHAIQASLGSSDFSIDMAVSMSDQIIEVPSLAPSQYELRALWESDDIVTQNDLTIQIPADVVEPGKTYRVRSRMQDNTGRWSHWSAPVEFVTTEATAGDLLNYLRVSEIMYNPLDDPTGTYNNDDFEYIELTNISDTQTLDLSHVSIMDGVFFNFSNSTITTLAPGESVVVVSHAQAFMARYSVQAAERVAGVYTGSLSNSGEKLQITDTWQGTIVNFEYNDSNAWPQTADGDGDALAPTAWFDILDIQAGILDNPDSWQAVIPTPGR